MQTIITNWYKKLKEKIRQSGFLGFDETVKESNLNKNYRLFRTPGRNSNSNLPACLQGTDDAFDRDAYLEELRPDLERIVTVQNETERCCYHKIQNMIIARGGRPTSEEEKHWIGDTVEENEWKYMSCKEWKVKITDRFGDDCELSAANAYRIATAVFGQETLREVKMEERKWIEGIVKANAGERISCNEWQAKIIENYGMDYALTAGNAYRIALESGMKRLRVVVTDDHRQYISNKVEELNINDEWWGPEEWREGICSKFEEDDRIAGKTAYQIALRCGMKRKRMDAVGMDRHHHEFIKKKVIETKKRWTSEDELHENICSEFEEGDRISKAKAYKIALESGMHTKTYQYTIDKMTAYNPNNVPMCNWCGEFRLKLLECTGCRSVRYCDRECQFADWGEHKKLYSHK